MKGRVDADVAVEAARQCWGAHELMLRLGFPRSNLTIGVAVPYGAEQDKPLEQRQKHAMVRLNRFARGGTQTEWPDGFTEFVLDCGVIPSTALFDKAITVVFGRVGSGEVPEAKLLKEFQLTNAWIGRVPIVLDLQRRGFGVTVPELRLEPPKAN